MQRLKIHKFGPIQDCELELTPFMILTGAQATGKSTIAKVSYFCFSLKDVLNEQLRKHYFNGILNEDVHEVEEGNWLMRNTIKRMRLNFMQIFGSTWGMDSDMSLEFEYADGYTMIVKLKKDPYNPNYLWFEFSDKLKNKFYEWNGTVHKSTVNYEQIRLFKADILKTLDLAEEIVYIPAGRSMMTLLSGQINYMYLTMDDNQKRAIDYCTQNYLERIMGIKQRFSEGTEKMVADHMATTDEKIDLNVIRKYEELSDKILKGQYRFVGNEERLQLSDGRYVKINYASSGQQEAVWIINILFYYLLYSHNVYFIIEEPESNLYPEAQMYMTELITLVKNSGHKMLVTTHSPYVLGSLNNLLFADKIDVKKIKEVNKVLNSVKVIKNEDLSAYYLKNGSIRNIKDDGLIENEVIDGASGMINEKFDALLEIQMR